MELRNFLIDSRVKPKYSSYQLLLPSTQRELPSQSPALRRQLLSHSLPRKYTSPFLPRKRHVPTVDKSQNIVHENWRRPFDTYDEIYPNIFVGGKIDAGDADRLKSLGITHLINVSTGDLYYKSGNCNDNFIGIPQSDHTVYRFSPFFAEAYRTIDEALATRRGKVLVYCEESTSRSITVVVAYLMIRMGLSVSDAALRLRSKRAINLCEGFLKQLIHSNEQHFRDSRYSSQYDYCATPQIRIISLN